MISRRTLLLALTLLLSFAAGAALHRRDLRCATLRHTLARSAPWFSSQGGNHGFSCSDYDHAPPLDKIIAAAWCIAVLATLRSVLIDIHAARIRRRIAQSEFLTPPGD